MEILTTVLSVSAIALVLTVIIIVAEYFFNNYGECEIDINKGDKKLVVEGGATLLSTLAEQKIFIPSACGGKATCGLCKIQVLAGAGPLLPTEVPYIDEKEREDNFRLACQVKVKNDLRILVPAELFSIKEYLTTISKIDILTHDIKGLRLELPAGEKISFKAGQYMQIYTKPYGKIKESVFRAYSIANPPSDNEAIELIIRQVPDGICTTYVHTQLKEQDQLRINGPYGDFYLRGDCKELIFIAGGSGLAPIRALVLDIIEKDLEYKMTFFFGAVTAKDLYYLGFFHDLAKKHSNFTFVPALSGPAPGDRWEGETGLITEVVDRYTKDSLDKEAYLCGSPGMIKACIEVLNRKGLTNDKIFYDEF